ncbi:hypothetical protein MKEN_01153000 [Mycena kentingensis (nom. inval.)]|nr:hypothetical protein MKEN_01153000 [Mycena kentingensis (nom. inval.)]
MLSFFAALSVATFASAVKCTDGLCLTEIFDAATRSTYGIAIPPGGKLTEDFVGRIDVPLPYGFAGLTVAAPNGPAAVAIPDSVVLSVFCCATTGVDPRSIGPHGTIVDFFQSSEDTLLQLPDDNGSGKITISPNLTKYNETLISFVFRCENCALPIPADEDAGDLVFFNSNTKPTVDPTTGRRMMDASGAIISTFSVGSFQDFVSEDYNAVLQAAGFA